MYGPWNVIKQLEVHNSRLNKEAIIEAEAKANNTEFFEGCSLALDKTITFGLKQIPEKTDGDGQGLSWDSFTLALTGFVNRDITGNMARDMVNRMMSSATKEQWNYWYRRILIKDLRCGVSEKTINKVVEKINANFLVPVFTVQLAHDSANHESKVRGRKLVEVKLDGVRIVTIVYPNGRVDQFSRNGKELVNFEHIKRQFSNIAKGFEEPMVFDGEIMSSSFQDLMKQVHRKTDVAADDAVLYLFDMLTLAEFEQGICNTPQIERSENLREWFNKKGLFLSLMNIRVVEQELIDIDTPEGYFRLREINRVALEGKYEGIMIKDPDAPYELKRSHAWLKLKPFIEVSLEAINVEEGTGRNKGRLGAILFRGIDDGKLITVSVGGGYSDQQRREYFDNAEDILGNIGEIRADAITQNQDGTYSLRFPRFLRFRGFVSGEKL